MMKYVMIIVLAASLAIGSNPATAMVAGGAGAEIPGVSPGKTFLDRTWTTWGRKNEAGSQVIVVTSLTSPSSFQAEGKGFEPSTGCPAPDFESPGKCKNHGKYAGF
jgi:hypothetical protein